MLIVGLAQYEDGKAIELEEDGLSFDILHNIIFYLYTGEISLVSDVSEKRWQVPDPTIPNLCSAEEIFLSATAFGLDDLSATTSGFLRATCTVGNITSRIFGMYAQMSSALREMYQEFFLKNWDKVKRHRSHEDYFKEKVNSCHDIEELKELFEQYRLLIRRETASKMWSCVEQGNENMEDMKERRLIVSVA